MLNALNFVKGAVAQKDLVPVLTHFHIYEGRIQGFNGRLTIDTPCPDLSGMDITVPAVPFLRAVGSCSGEPGIKIDDNKIIVKSGKFTAKLPLADHATFPKTEDPGGEGQELSGGLLSTLRALRPFVSEDASRLWSLGILFRGGMAYATNNVLLIRGPLPFPAENLILPVNAVDELIRIGKDPIKVRIADNSITFEYEDGSWLRSLLISGDWPPVGEIIDKHMLEGNDWRSVPEGLRDAVDKLAPFCPDEAFPVLYLDEDRVTTDQGDKSAFVDGFEWEVKSGFHVKALKPMLQMATLFNPEKYPDPCPFAGGSFDGVILGVHIR